jgi:hypothetical protein
MIQMSMLLFEITELKNSVLELLAKLKMHKIFIRKATRNQTKRIINLNATVYLLDDRFFFKCYSYCVL